MIRHSLTALSGAALVVLAATGCVEESIPVAAGDPSSLQVWAYVDADGDGSTAGEVIALEGATVTALTASGGLTATVDASGVARFEAVPPGTVTLALTATPPAGAVLATASNPVVVAPFRGAELEAEFRFAFLPGSASGRLFRDENDNGVFDAGVDFGPAGIPVTLSRDGEVVAEGVTGADGAFSFTGLRPGVYQVSFDLPSTVDVQGPVEVTVPADAAGQVAAIFTGSLVIPIADARAASEGQTVTVEGVVTWQTQWDERVYFLQDGTAGISTFHFGAPTLQLGDRIQITGERDAFGGEVQIGSITAIQVLENVAVPSPRGVTGAQIVAGDFQGELVVASGTVVSVVEVNSFGTHVATIEDAAGTRFEVFVDNRTGVATGDWPAPGSAVRVTGVLGTSTTPRLELRFPSDLETVPAGVISIAEARAMDGATVTVQGTVTRLPAWDDRIAFVQDGTGGINVFSFSLPALAEGDVVTMTGEVGSFNGEVDFSPSSVTVESTGGAVPDPLDVTVAQINDGLFQGQLVRLSGTVESVNDLGFALEVAVDDGSGTTARVFVDSDTGLVAADFAVGEPYVVVGVLGFFDGNDPGAQLEVIRSSDVTQG